MSPLYHLIPSDVRVKFFSKPLWKILGHVRRGHGNISREFEAIDFRISIPYRKAERSGFSPPAVVRQTMVNHIQEQVRHVLKTAFFSSRSHIAAFSRSLFFLQEYKGATLHSWLSKSPAHLTHCSWFPLKCHVFHVLKNKLITNQPITKLITSDLVTLSLCEKAKIESRLNINVAALRANALLSFTCTRLY